METLTTIPKEAKRWYLVMLFCVLLSFFSFMAGPRIGYAPEYIERAAILIGLWAPTLGILGVRAELVHRFQRENSKITQ